MRLLSLLEFGILPQSSFWVPQGSSQEGLRSSSKSKPMALHHGVPVQLWLFVYVVMCKELAFPSDVYSCFTPSVSTVGCDDGSLNPCTVTDISGNDSLCKFLFFVSLKIPYSCFFIYLFFFSCWLYFYFYFVSIYF